MANKSVSEGWLVADPLRAQGVFGRDRGHAKAAHDIAVKVARFLSGGNVANKTAARERACAEVPNFMALFPAISQRSVSRLDFAQPCSGKSWRRGRPGVLPNWVFNRDGTFYKGSR
jgi:hypothetical protein